jgi:hypothetical protein
VTNCENLVQDFAWATELIAAVTNNELPKVKYYREVHSLKKDKSAIAKKTETEVISTED